MYKPPTEQEIFQFVMTTHQMDRIPVHMDQCVNTWHQLGNYKHQPNPFAQGHFRAFMYMMYQLIPSNDFPAKEASLLRTTADSENALFWLKDLHHKMADPLVNHSQAEGEFAINSILVGRYRVQPAVGVRKECPAPYILPKIMHNWIKDYATFHEKIKGKIDNPYAFDKEMGYAIVEKAYEANLFFCAVQPLSCLNQRMGRLLENCFRLAWRLPMKYYTPHSDDTSRLPADIMAYEDKLPVIMKQALEVR